MEWCRNHIDEGHVVVAGFYDKNHDDPDYDHIMPVVGYKKDHAGNTLGIFYNDLYVTSGPRYLSVEIDIQKRSNCKVSNP